MNTFIYDGSYEGLLSVIFESFTLKTTPNAIVSKKEFQSEWLETAIPIETNEEKANELLTRLEACSSNAVETVMKAFLSEQPEIELVIFHYCKHLISAKGKAEDPSNPFVLQLKKLKKQLDQETQRMQAFVRFQKTADDIHYANIDPDFNVLPLIGDHFEKRYPNQKWMIFDTKRNYGLYYDLEKTTYIKINEIQINLRTEKENSYQSLWKNYFESTNTRERKNVKFHLQQLPKKNWKYLPEKI
ncbi:MAG TPA: TIGR03915 family putative DNA repair protein [Cytophagaceae bacterium]|jgi:probable DNA metabolism protein|nr:TIGR03915 family putative DNA repair protein [Cytophagaceae bacterium]